MAELIPLAAARGALTKNVIFVHGLDGDPLGTWTSPPPPENNLWPKWLAEDIDGLAVWSVGYEAALSDWLGSAMNLPDRSENVLSRLLVNSDLGEGELIFVGHSLGGLVIKQVLRKAADKAGERADAYSLVDHTRKVVFLATPHTGADLAGWADRLRLPVRPSAATRSLPRNDPHLRELNLWYRTWARQHGVENLILSETKTTSAFGMIVKPDSSDPGLLTDPIPIDADHITIAKPQNRDSQVYLLIRDFIQRRIERPITPAEKGIDDLRREASEIRSLQRTDSLKLSQLVEALNWIKESGWNWLRKNFIKATFLVIAVITLTFAVQHPPLPLAKALCIIEERLIPSCPLPVTKERFGVVVASLDHDDIWRTWTKRVVKQFDGVGGIDVGCTCDALRIEGTGERVTKAAKTGREWLSQHHADLLIFGEILGNAEALNLKFLPVEGEGELSPTTYRLELNVLKKDFDDAAATQLQAIALAAVAPATAEQGKYLVKTLQPVASRLERLVSDPPKEFTPDRRAAIQSALGLALSVIGEQAGDPGALQKSADAFQKALNEHRNPEHASLDWAETQLNFGNALARLGQFEEGTKTIRRAIDAYREALTVYEPGSLDWAMTQMNLGIANEILGERESDPKSLEKAIDAYDKALETYKGLGAGGPWATTQMNRGNALMVLGHLDEAIRAFNEAQNVYKPGLVPLKRAKTLFNLGNAYMAREEFRDAVHAYSEALNELLNTSEDNLRNKITYNLDIAKRQVK